MRPVIAAQRWRGVLAARHVTARMHYENLCFPCSCCVSVTATTEPRLCGARLLPPVGCEMLPVTKQRVRQRTEQAAGAYQEHVKLSLLTS